MNNKEEYNKILKNCKFNISQLENYLSNEKLDIDGQNFDAFTPFDSNIIDACKFDIDYYKKHYLRNIENCDPIKHYLNIGIKKGFNPNAFFDSEWYLKEYPDVKNANLNPFIHYIEYGFYEGRIPKILKWNEFYQGLENLKSAIKGRNNYLFLVNDSNKEILQHFDEDYESIFDSKTFEEDMNFKKDTFAKNNIDYHFFIVPDKSIVCKKFLPFEYKTIKRNADLIDDIIDFEECLNPTHYFKHDTHMNFEGGRILTFKILNYINKDFSLEDYENLLSSNKEDKYYYKTYDLLRPLNWSYSPAEKMLFPKDTGEHLPIPKDLKNLKNEIPSEFLYVHERESFYFRNENSFSNLRVLIFRDSSFNYLQMYFPFYFKEIFYYWDHGNLNKELIEWYKPDLILEIRIERFLEALPRASWIENKKKLVIND